MRGEERLRGGLRATLRCGVDAVVLEDRPDGVAGDVVTETLEPTAHAARAFALRITSAARSGLVLRRPRRRALEPSYFWATSVRYDPQDGVRSDKTRDGHQSAPTKKLALSRPGGSAGRR
jgi:hypothetical protein